jgi:hypothetical protein
MTRRFLIILFILAFAKPECFPQTVSNDDKLRDIVVKYGQAEVIIPYIDPKSIDDLTRKVSILSVHDKLIKISLSRITVEWFILQKFDYQIVISPDTKGVIMALNTNQAMGWETYPTYTQYDSIMKSFTILYPGLCHLDTIGTSVNGKLVLALKISDNASTDEAEPEVFYSSTIHGNETGGFILMLRLTDYLLKNYNLNSRVKNLVDNLEIWINPLANPDGTYGTGNIISSPTRYNTNGVDLNRNFPDPDLQTGIQQKENKDMIRFMRKHKFVMSVNFHSGVEVVNYPWDRWQRLHADNDWFYDISRKYADTAHLHSASDYMSFEDNGVTNGYYWYQVYGGRQDFMTYTLHGREVTIELDNNYITPVNQLNSLWEYNWRSLLGYMENVLYGIHGQVINAISSVPVPANVYIAGHDKDNSNVYSDTLTGNFTRLIAPGSWNLTFSAIGYKDTTIDNLVVYPWQKTGIIVRMVPVETESILLYPNPVIGEIKAILPGSVSGEVNIRIISQSGRILSEYTTETIQGIPLEIDLKRFSGGAYTIVFTNTVTKKSCQGKFIVIK